MIFRTVRRVGLGKVSTLLETLFHCLCAIAQSSQPVSPTGSQGSSVNAGRVELKTVKRSIQNHMIQDFCVGSVCRLLLSRKYKARRFSIFLLSFDFCTELYIEHRGSIQFQFIGFHINEVADGTAGRSPPAVSGRRNLASRRTCV